MPVRRGIPLRGLPGVVQLCAVAVITSACVATAEVRETHAEAAAGPPPPPPDHKSAGQLVAPRHVTGATAPEQPPKKIPRGKVWVSGDWHWDGVRYVWVPGHLEDAAPAYTWGR